MINILIFDKTSKILVTNFIVSRFLYQNIRIKCVSIISNYKKENVPRELKNILS